MTLAALRADLATQLAAVEADLAQLRASRAAESADDEHDPEGSTLSDDWSRLAGRRRDLADRLAAADRALARDGTDDAGRCIRCGAAIAPERLAALPATELCIDCARAVGP